MPPSRRPERFRRLRAIRDDKGSRPGRSRKLIPREAPGRGDRKPFMERLVLSLLHWLVAVSGHPLPAELPELRQMPGREMPCRCAAFYQYPQSVQGYGVSIRRPGRILIRADVDLATERGRSILLHELVHAAQAVRGPVPYGTSEWHSREAEAYALQSHYLQQQGIFDDTAARYSARDD